MDYEDDFFMSCITVAAQQEGNSLPISPTATLVSPTTTAFGDLDLTKDVPKDILSQSYPGAVSDFYGLPTNPICIY